MQLRRLIARTRSARRIRVLVEALETRTCLSTYIINGTGGNDTWTLSASAGQVILNGVTTNNASISDVQVNGLVGSDSLTINSASIPIVFNGGDGGDTLSVTSGHLALITGAVTFNGSLGGDTMQLSALPSAVSGSASFTFNGGAGDFDFAKILNTSSTDAWTYTRTQTSVRADRSGYFLQVGTDDIEYSYITGGTLVDQFLVQGAPANSTTELDGAGGNDVYTLGNAQSASGILGAVTVDGGAAQSDSVTIDDRASSIARTVHIDAGSVGAQSGDNLFGAGGSLLTASIAGPLTLKLGSGADTVYAVPDPLTPIYVEGNNPTTSPGDFLGIAAVGTANPQHVPAGGGAGTFTFGDRADIHYTGIEQTSIDNAAPTVADSSFASTPSGHRVRFVFSEPVIFPANPTNWLELYDMTGGTYLDASTASFAYDSATGSANFTFPGYPNGRLPDGRYRATLYSGIPDLYGNRTAADASVEFFVTSGTGGDDTFQLFRTSAGGVNSIKLYKNVDPASNPPTWTIDLANLSDLIIDGLGGDDELLVWPDTGTVSTSAEIFFSGGAGSDTLDLRGSANFQDNVGLDPAYAAINAVTVFHSGIEDIAFDGDGGADIVNIGGGPPITFLDTQQLAALTIPAAARAIMAAGADATLVVDDLQLDPAGTLDMTDNDLVVNNSSYADIFAKVMAGRGASTGIISSTSNGSRILALFDNSWIGATQWNGQLIGPHAIVGNYTVFGDVNFDGRVTGDDYTVIDSRLGDSPPPGLQWLSGDANLDGVITGDDYTTVDSNFGLSAVTPSALAPLKLREDLLISAVELPS